MYLPVKNQIRLIIDRHFPPEISQRFTIRMDTEIFKKSEDEGVWNRWRRDRENIHILFDGLELFEVPQQIKQSQAEVYFLRCFKWAIEDGKISIEKKKEWTDNDTAKRNRRAREKKKKEAFVEAYKRSVQNPGNYEEHKANVPNLGDITIFK